MKITTIPMRKITSIVLSFILSISLYGCAQNMGAQIQWDSKDQILLSEDSQVKLRSVQTQILDTTDKEKVLKSAIYAMQDLFFEIDVVDHNLGILSGKKLFRNDHSWSEDPTYNYYDTDDLIIFSTNFRTFGPFKYRSDLTRLTITLRPRGETQLILRASVQYNIGAVESPEVYQKFFSLLRQSLFISSELN